MLEKENNRAQLLKNRNISEEKTSKSVTENLSHKLTRRRYPLTAFFLLAIFVVMALFGPWIAPYGANEQDLARSLPLMGQVMLPGVTLLQLVLEAVVLLIICRSGQLVRLWEILLCTSRAAMLE